MIFGGVGYREAGAFVGLLWEMLIRQKGTEVIIFFWGGGIN